MRCAREKVTCEVLLSTPPVGYSRLLTAVNETYCNKKKKDLTFHELHQLLDCPSSTRNRSRKSAISDVVEEKWVVQLLRLILDGDGF